MKQRPAVIAILLAAVGLVAAYATVNSEVGDLAHWQRRAAKVSAGMSRKDVEKLLPPPDFSGALWRLEDFRFRHAHWLPSIRYAPKSAMISSNAWKQQGYEVAPNIFVTILYDHAGALPGPSYAGKNTLQPGDHVIGVPIVTDTKTALDTFESKTYKY